MPALRTTKAEIKRLTTNPSTKQIIDGLWRAPLWMHDEVLLSPDDEFRTEVGEDYDLRYIYSENSFLDADDNQVSFASAEGFGNKLQANFANVIGFFNTATSFAETIIGTHGLTGYLQTPNEWIVTDRLFTIANGADANSKSDAFNMYKSGFSVFKNATAVGAYSHGAIAPPNGAFQFDNAFKGYWDNAWHTFATTDQISSHSPVTLDPESSIELWVNENQVIGIDLSAYAKTANIHPAVSLGAGSETELALNPTTQVLTLTGLKKTFLSLNDTFDAYPTQGYGNGLIAGTSAVGYSNSFGVDDTSFWITATENRTLDSTPKYIDLGSWDYFTLGTGWTKLSSSVFNYTSGGGLLTTNSFYLLRNQGVEEYGTEYGLFFALTSGVVNVYLNGPNGTTQIAVGADHYCEFTVTVDGNYSISFEASQPLSISDISLMYYYPYWVYTYSQGIRVVNNAHQTQVIYPTHAGAAGDVCVLDDDGITMVFKPLSASLTGVILDTDFPAAGLMLTDGAGNYSVITDNSATWNTALVDADFASNGIMVRTGAGAYSTVADNSATWNTLASLGTKTFWNGTQAAYDAIGTKDSNTIYFINV